MAEPRRFPAPWRVEEKAESYIVHDANNLPIACVYFDDEPSRRSVTNRLTKDGRQI